MIHARKLTSVSNVENANKANILQITLQIVDKLMTTLHILKMQELLIKRLTL